MHERIRESMRAPRCARVDAQSIRDMHESMHELMQMRELMHEWMATRLDDA